VVVEDVFSFSSVRDRFAIVDRSAFKNARVLDGRF
jgi:hypothetical protein